MKPHLQTTLWTLLKGGATQREIERITGISRHTTLKCITEGANALIIGKLGTGKSHVAKAMAYQATQQGYDVRYVEADTEFARYGLASTEEQAELFQSIVHQRYKLRRAILITSNRVVQDWGKYLGDATMATTMLDRLMHRCAMLEFEGKSYRLKEAASRTATAAE